MAYDNEKATLQVGERRLSAKEILENEQEQERQKILK
jgi:hypothetical protein